MVTMTTPRIEDVERLVNTERERAVRAATKALMYLVAAAASWMGSDQENFLVGIFAIFTLMITLVIPSFYIGEFISSKLKHAEYLAELTRLRTLNDKAY